MEEIIEFLTKYTDGSDNFTEKYNMRNILMNKTINKYNNDFLFIDDIIKIISCQYY